MTTSFDTIHSAAEARTGDRREGPRKTCRVRAVFDAERHPPLSGRTVDLGHNGVSLLLPSALPKGCIGTVAFSVFVNGKLETIRNAVEVSNCVFLSHDVRVGFQFVNLAPSNKRLLDALMR